MTNLTYKQRLSIRDGAPDKTATHWDDSNTYYRYSDVCEYDVFMRPDSGNDWRRMPDNNLECPSYLISLSDNDEIIALHERVAELEAQIPKWVSVEDGLPELRDDSVLAYFSDNGGIDMVHIEDYFGDITNGLDEGGKQLYTKWYKSQGVTHWMPLPTPPEEV